MTNRSIAFATRASSLTFGSAGFAGVLNAQCSPAAVTGSVWAAGSASVPASQSAAAHFESGTISGQRFNHTKMPQTSRNCECEKHTSCAHVILRNGKTMQRSVLILGGGIAGLTAAAELLAHNWRVTIVEAKSRLGGRVHTIHDGSTPIELGAEFVHGNDPALGDLIRKAGLSTHNVCDENRWFKDGRLESIGLWERVGETMHRIDPRRDDEPFATFTARELKNKDDREMALGFVQGFNAADPGRISAHALLRSEVSSE